MSTAMATATVIPINELKATHRGAEEVKAKTWALVTAAEARAGTLSRDLAASDLSVRLAARVELPRVEQGLDELMVAAAAADEAEAAARESIKAAVRAECFNQKKIVVPRLAAILLQARTEVDKLAAIQDREQSECGSVPDRIDWVALQSSTPTFTPWLDSWLDAMRSYNLLD